MKITHGGGMTLGRAHSAAGFTLVELLVTILMIGLLAAIAIPTFVKQRHKAIDANAKHLVATGALALQSYAAEHDDYAATDADLRDLAPELGQAANWTLNATVSSYTVSVTSDSGHVFTIERGLSGPAQRTCTTGSDPAGSGGCPGSGTW
jgi:type IV pilus assembly protein PilA